MLAVLPMDVWLGLLNILLALDVVQSSLLLIVVIVATSEPSCSREPSRTWESSCAGEASSSEACA